MQNKIALPPHHTSSTDAGVTVCLWVILSATPSNCINFMSKCDLQHTACQCPTFLAQALCAELQSLMQLSYLYLGSNQLEGSLPEAWSNWTSVSPQLSW